MPLFFTCPHCLEVHYYNNSIDSFPVCTCFGAVTEAKARQYRQARIKASVAMMDSPDSYPDHEPEDEFDQPPGREW